MLRHGAPPSDVAELVMAVAQPGDTAAVAILRKAAAQTGRVSSPVAGQLSRRALDLMPPGDPGRGALVAETTGYLVQAGQAAEAVRLIAASAGDLAGPAAEAEARLSLAVILMQYAPADVVEQCRRALDLPGVPPRCGSSCFPSCHSGWTYSAMPPRRQGQPRPPPRPPARAATRPTK
jgi:hypothetical protein